MIDLVPKMASPLAATVMVQEQLGLTLNRAGRGDEAEQVLLDLQGCLLAETYPIGRSKAKFFRSVGFDESNAWILEQGLIEIAKTGEIVETAPSVHDVKYIDGGDRDAARGARWHAQSQA